VSRLCQARVRFGHGTDDVHDEAIWLVCWVLHLPVAHYDALADATVAWPEVRAVLDLVERRCSERRPLAYLVGEAWLMGYRFRCDARALVPRSLIAEALLEHETIDGPTVAGLIQRGLDEAGVELQRQRDQVLVGPLPLRPEHPRQLHGAVLPRAVGCAGRGGQGPIRGDPLGRTPMGA